MLVVDGYNVIHGMPELTSRLDESLEAGRNALLRRCVEWRRRRREFTAMYVVFDGNSAAGGTGDGMHGGVAVVFTREREEADDRIRTLLDGELDGKECVVVTDDRDLADAARSRGAGTMAVAEFCGTLRGFADAGAKQHMGEDGAGKAGLSSEEARRINNELRREWGIRD